MIKLYEIMLYLFLFALVSTGIYLVFINIGITNDNLDDESKQDLVNLNIYQNKTQNPFLNSDGENANVNYSLTAYSNTGEFEQSNVETKGAMEAMLNILGNNKLTALKAPITFFYYFSPLPKSAFDWATNMILGFFSIVIFIAAMVAWKSGVWSKE